METVKKIRTKLLYNENDVTADFSNYLQSIVYKDFEEDESDEITVTLKDNDKLFQNGWYPEKGAKLSLTIGYDNSENFLNCGTFTIDENLFNFSPYGDTLEIRGLAATINEPLRMVNTDYYEKTSLFEIAEKIAEKYHLEVIKGTKDIQIERVNQVQENDLAFLRRISKDYGYMFKITDNFIVFLETDREKLPLFTLTKQDIREFEILDSSTNIFKECRVDYFNPETKKLCTFTATQDIGSGTLKIRQKCTSKEQAKLIAEANLKTQAKEVTCRIILREGNPYFMAGVSFNIAGFGRFDGTYHIKNSTHKVSNSGWEVFGEAEKC